MGNKLNNIVLITFATFIIACSHKSTNSQASIPDSKTNFIKATIVNYRLDGCSWMLQLEDGRKLEPVNLKEEFKKENFPVWIQYQTYTGNSICMAGEMITITAIEKR